MNDITFQNFSIASVPETYLSADDRTKIQAMSDELRDTIVKRQIWRTETEMRISVLDDVHFPTKAAKYWQAVREQAVFIENLVQGSFDYRKNEVEIRKLERDIKNCDDEFDRELLTIELERKIWDREHKKLRGIDIVRELSLWSKIKNEMDDGSFDKTSPNTHQLESLTMQFLIRAATLPDSITSAEKHNIMGSVMAAVRVANEAGVMESVMSKLPQEVALKLNNYLEHKDEHLLSN